MATGQSQRKIDGGKIKGGENVPSCIEVRTIWSIANGKNISAVCHGRYSTAPTNMQTLAESLFTGIKSGWTANLAPISDAGTSILRVQIRDMTSHTNPVFESTGAAAPGTGPGVAMPADSAIVLTEQVSMRGRGLKGRMYLGGFSVDADGGGGLMSVAAQTAATAFGTAVFNTLTAQNLTPCVAQVDRQDYIGLDGAAHAARTANSNVLVSSYVCKDREWDTQRRRGN